VHTFGLPSLNDLKQWSRLI